MTPPRPASTTLVFVKLDELAEATSVPLDAGAQIDESEWHWSEVDSRAAICDWLDTNTLICQTPAEIPLRLPENNHTIRARTLDVKVVGVLWVDELAGVSACRRRVDLRWGDLTKRLMRTLLVEVVTKLVERDC